ncbi:MULTISPECIES: hypothetical protein [Paenibacillus]|uniref:hypothetical protein n=1 Tax=Paenibacillus TaxID=44249 RepID=UPI0003728E71|nr:MULTISPECIES: hypothetical protein [Paenibacillus]
MNWIKSNFRKSDFIAWYVIMAILLVILEFRNHPGSVSALSIIITLITLIIPAAIFSFCFRMITGWIVNLNK